MGLSRKFPAFLSPFLKLILRITGLEPARKAHQNLNLACLPIPPYPQMRERSHLTVYPFHAAYIISLYQIICQYKNLVLLLFHIEYYPLWPIRLWPAIFTTSTRLSAFHALAHPYVSVSWHYTSNSSASFPLANGPGKGIMSRSFPK